MNRTVQMPSRCWEVAGDDWHPHFANEAEAQGSADEIDPTPVVALLPSPCWEAHCSTCGGDMVDGEGYSHIHHRHAVDAEENDSLTCELGCEPPGPDPLAPSAAGMEPIPGIEGAT